MENKERTDDEEGGAAGAKLIPEWNVAADDQVLMAGLAVVGILALLLGWNAWFGGDDGDGIDTDFATEVAAGPAGDEVAADVDGDGLAVAPITTTTLAPTTTTEAAEESTTTTAAAAPVIGDVQASVDPFPGVIEGAAEGTVAVLDGFVANDAESREAEAAAAAVEGITAVENNLVVLEPAVTAALTAAGVTGATAVGEGTTLTVSGTIDTEDDRQPAIDAAAAVDGVTEVVDDRLNVSVTADLNALPQVQFATSSAEILSASFADLDAAAALLQDAGDVRIEVQGYTDVQGDAAANQTLSEERAESVRSYLVDAGVNVGILSASGFGETEQFGSDLASNRVVRFQQIDS